MNDAIYTLLWSLAYFVLGAGVLYAVVRAAIVSALRHHALWRADGSFEIEIERHRRDSAV